MLHFSVDPITIDFFPKLVFQCQAHGFAVNHLIMHFDYKVVDLDSLIGHKSLRFLNNILFNSSFELETKYHTKNTSKAVLDFALAIF